MSRGPTQPTAPGAEPQRWHFADVVLDERARELRVRDEPIVIDRKPFDVLAYLVRNAGAVVTKDQLAGACWPGRILSDSVLTRTLSRVRAALGDFGQVVETVHGVGWRVAIPVQRGDGVARAPPGNLPAPLTALLGRDAVLRTATELLRRKDRRLLTLTGCGGIGKTRLALALGAELAADFAHGVFFVDLAATTTPDRFAAAVAHALGVREAGAQPLLETVRDQLRDRRLLLVLDNFEQVVAAAPQLALLLVGAPGVRAVVTSREPLGIRGENLIDVPTLELPGAGSAPPATLGDYAAIALFVERARMVKADFALTPANGAAVAQICRRLDGLPLALELAAARTRLFSVDALLHGLEDRFGLLRDGAADLPARQQTLWATIDWSYRLLEPGEQAVLRRASVFAGGFTLEAAQAVMAGRGVAAADVFHLLARLVDKSLLRYEDQGLPGRYRMLETIREYAARRLAEAAEDEATRDRHLDECLRLAAESGAHLWLFLPEAAMRAWAARIDAELDNVRAALAWSLAREPAAARGLQLMGTLHWFWFERGYIGEARQWLERLLPRAAGAAPHVRAQALVAAANLAVEQGGDDDTRTALFAFARAALHESLATFRALGDRSWTAYVLSSLASAAVTESGDAEEAGRHVAAGLALAREAGDRWLIAYLTHFAGRGAFFGGDPDGAAAAFTESVAVAREIGGHSVGEGYGLYWLGRIALVQGDLARAVSFQREALTLFHAAGNLQGVATTCAACGHLAARRGDATRAAMLLSAVAAWRADRRIYLEPDVGAELDRHLAEARDALGEAAFASACAAGQALDRAAAVATALD